MVGKNQKEKNVDRGALMEERDGVKDLMEHLEEEYRKAEVSEENYNELKEKYAERLRYIDAQLGETLNQREKPVSKFDEAQSEEKKPEEKRAGGFFSKLIPNRDKRLEDKEEDKEPSEVDLGGLDPSDPRAIEMLAAQVSKQSVGDTAVEPVESTETDSRNGTPNDIEIEKLKVMIDTLRESNKALQESVTNLSESLGEVRSMVFQTEGEEKELSAKAEKIEDEISGLKPKEIEKRFRDFNVKLGQVDIIHEKLQTKLDDVSQKANRMEQIMKSIGGVENLINVNKTIQQKLNDIKEALQYTERLALKTEKIFIDMNRNMQDIVIYKTRQESLEDTVKEILKNVDGIKVDLQEIPSKKDLETLRGDVFVFQKELQEIKKVLPLVDAKIPESITSLRTERNNILLFLDSLREHLESGVITNAEYEDARKKNLKKLERIDKDLKDEWDKLKGVLGGGALPKEEPAEASENEVDKSEDDGKEEPENVRVDEKETRDGKERSEEAKSDEDEKDAVESKPEEKEEPPSKQYKCEVCGEAFSSGRAKGGHMSKHKKGEDANPENATSAAVEKQVDGSIPKLAEHIPQEEVAEELPGHVDRPASQQQKTSEEDRMRDLIDKIKKKVDAPANPELPVGRPPMTQTVGNAEKENMSEIIKKIKEKMK